MCYWSTKTEVFALDQFQVVCSAVMLQGDSTGWKFLAVLYSPGCRAKQRYWLENEQELSNVFNHEYMEDMYLILCVALQSKAPMLLSVNLFSLL